MGRGIVLGYGCKNLILLLSNVIVARENDKIWPDKVDGNLSAVALKVH